MSKFLITYHNSKMPDDPKVLEQAKIAFGNWLQQAGKSVIDPGAPVFMVTQVASESPSSAVEVGGYSIIEAADENEAVKILKAHPFVARGGTLQVNKIMGI